MPCFGADRTALYAAYEELIHHYPGWRLPDVRALTHAERNYLLETAYWRAEKSSHG